MEKVDFEGRTVIVTGAGNGIGRAHAFTLAERGARVVVNDLGGAVDGSGSSGAAEAVAQEIRRLGGIATASTDSVATVEGGAALVRRAMNEFGRVDAVIHNAGILRDRTFGRMTDDDITAVLDVHLGGAFNVLRPAWKHMVERGYGRIVLTTSSSGLLGTFGQSSYAAAKAGLIGLMNVLALEGERYGIRVNALSPTAATRMTEGLLGELADRFDPRHVAAVAAYLASEQCDLNRQILTAGGGRVGRIFLGVTPGWYSGPEPASPEDILEAIDEIRSLDDHIVPRSGADEVALIQKVLGA
ncbi:NAD(P)-dependent dehydrogenase, short-chain alcohol dehydrogenase family [Thermomonospora echinospora]|uniref:NAD(P)-dependent dehydrogenase, short-chain alcohol dehydrogenase family n=1 Tax=Thermomonospora echinospora TaxID=1992 RepID=A0A1H6DMA4_9ACTN|nr:SDR family NAD(P)-dependent oxidoreductase [Thermomonospora echinospora]SEG86319.1 NAD(P)-dependent dehydrogenase, short-chain alcohol dehydrogenase family [Thermomonospora echinospora]